MLTYSDPWKDAKFGKLQGEMPEVFTVLEFDDGKIYKEDSSYVLLANFTSASSVVRRYKNEQLTDFPIIATWIIHEKNYEIRTKENDEWKNKTLKASLFEQDLYQHITANPAQWLDKNIKGKIQHQPDENYITFGKDLTKFVAVAPCEPSARLPEYSSAKKNNGYGYAPKGISPEDRLIFIKDEIHKSIADDKFRKLHTKTDATLATLLGKFIRENEDNETFLSVYFDLIKSMVV